ncbi:MAG: L-threonylcarbamoyladenylate synthase [Polyangiaceae bacterium]|nr:L-threonylcarbamoyladenylate synthase [Polyangiaceae bacterium]MCB9606992.1 L-threonylcarbamoyladenylate synthase [Polyangiaceae bacterium]
MRRVVGERAALELLLLGEVVAVATESSFGLLADANNPRAVDRLLKTKHRDNKGIGLIVPGLPQWAHWVHDVPETARLLAEKFWPGGLTIVLPAAHTVDTRLTHAGTIGVREAGPSAARRLAKLSGLTLTATSANPPGEPAALDHTSAEQALPGVWVVVGHAPGGLPSTLVALDEGRARLIREGAVPRQAVGQVVALD